MQAKKLRANSPFVRFRLFQLCFTKLNSYIDRHITKTVKRRIRSVLFKDILSEMAPYFSRCDKALFVVYQATVPSTSFIHRLRFVKIFFKAHTTKHLVVNINLKNLNPKVFKRKMYGRDSCPIRISDQFIRRVSLYFHSFLAIF